MRAWRTQVSRGAWRHPQSAQQLHLDRDGEVLLFTHTLRRLGMNHNPAVASGPSRPARCLLSHEPILHADDVMRELLAVKQVPEFTVELVVLIVGDFQQAVLYPESIAEVVIQIVAGDFDVPTLQVLTVEELNPLLLIGIILRPCDSS